MTFVASTPYNGQVAVHRSGIPPAGPLVTERLRKAGKQDPSLIKQISAGMRSSGGRYAVIAQQVERILGKDEVSGSIPDNSSKRKRRGGLCVFLLHAIEMKRSEDSCALTCEN